MPSSSNGLLILPLVLWDKRPPDCHISSLIVSESEKYILTGTSSGHIITWDFNVNEIVPVSLMIGHTGAVNCLARAGHSKDEEFIVSSSENGEMKLWEINERKCIESIKMSNNVHKNIYSSKINGKYTRLFCIGNYSDVLVMDPMTLDILYTLVSRESPQWIKALCINTLQTKLDDVIVGVSVTGTIKLWTLNANEQKGSEIIEHEFKNCKCENANTLSSCPGKQRIFIVVCPKFFQIFDAFDFTVLCEVNINTLTKKENSDSIVFTNGFFLDIENVVVCSNDGVSYLFELPDSVNPQSESFRQREKDSYPCAKLITKLITNEKNDTKPTNFYGPPAFYLYEMRKKLANESQKTQRYLIKGDSNARLSIWNMNKKFNILNRNTVNDYEMSLKQYWKENVVQENESYGEISTFLYLSAIDKLVYGMNDGSIIILPAIEFLIRNCFGYSSKQKFSPVRLKKHDAKVTCILYPHAEHSRYDPTMLVTGSADFSIILWNINTGEVVHRFVVQTGEILQLSIPPNNVNPRILQCICSIASDHSVALLSLKECKSVMIASRHLFPITLIKWRPLDDYLLVKCSDGGVFVWQIETGSLDRVAHGLLAEDILNAADELTGNHQYIGMSEESSTSPNMLISSPINSNNYYYYYTMQQQQQQSQQQITTPSNKTQQPAHSSFLSTPMIVSNKLVTNQTIALMHILQKRNFTNSAKLSGKSLNYPKDDQKKFQSIIDSSTLNFPLVIQPIQMSANDPVNHLVLFDVDSLLTNLTLEEQAIDAIVKHIKNSFFKETHNIQTAPVQVISPLYRSTTDHAFSTLKRNASAKLFDSIDLKQLNYLKSKVNYAQSILKLIQILLSSLHIWLLDEPLDKLFSEKLNLRKPKYPISFGRITRSFHIVVSFPPKRSAFNFETKPLDQTDLVVSAKSRLKKDDSVNLINFDAAEEPKKVSTIDSTAIKSPTKESWLATKTVNTEHLLAMLAISNSFMSLNNFIDLQLKKEDADPIEFILGEKSSHSLPTEENNYGEEQALIKQSYSRMSTMYCMLADYYSNEASSLQIKPLNLETLALKWMDQSYEIRDAAQALLKNELKRVGPMGRANLIKIWEPHLTSLLKDFDDLSQLSIQNADQNAAVVSASTTDLSKTSSARIRRKQFVAIIVLSLIGAEFGQDVNSNKTQAPYKTIPQGFSLEDHSILKRISTALFNLVINKSLGHDITRRAAIDLIARGFAIWEPFIQPTHILLSLLELAADAELYVPKLCVNLPLAPFADTCRLARNSLILIANSKPKTFILTVAKEIKRVNASSNQASQASNVTYPFLNALTRGKQEILHIIEKLIDNQAQDVFELLSDVIEIILFCLDPNQIRNLGLEDCFPAIFKFPMVRYCKETKRILCGCHNGRLVMYEYKNSKWNFQSYPAHNSQPIVAAGISYDSKYVASFSATDNSLIFWQSSGGNIFNIGSSSLKQVKVCNTAPLETNNVSITRIASVSWQNRTLFLTYHDNRKFSYQA